MTSFSTRKMRALGLCMTLILMLTMLGSGKAQTTLIGPANGGDFELGTDFASNGWTVLNYGVTTNSNWYLGTGLTYAGVGGTWNFPTASRCAYISNNGGANWQYGFTDDIASTSFFYRDVTFPAGETNIQLTFDIVSNGEGSNWENFYVWVCPTSITPTLGSPSGTSDVATWTGGSPTQVYKKQGTSSTTLQTSSTVTVVLPAGVIGNCVSSSTMRLVFGWKNDGSVIYEPPTAIDNIALTTSTVTPSPTLATFTIDNTLATGGTNFNSFTAAINWLNAAASCGISNPITFNVAAGQSFTEDPPVITASGTVANPITFQKSGAGANPVLRPTGTAATNEGGIVVSGGDFFTFNGIDVTINTGSNLEYGYVLRNASATNGCNNNTITNATITLNRSLTTSIGVLVTASTTGGGLTPTAASGNNNFNIISNCTLTNMYNGVLVTSGTSTWPDDYNQVSNCVIGTTYGGAPTGDIGGGTSSSYGIQMNNQRNYKVNGNTVRNMTVNGFVSARGIYGLAGQGNNEIYNNKVQGLRNLSTTATTGISGIEATMTTTLVASTKIYNNMVSDLTSAYTSTATSTRQIKGIFTGSGAAGGAYHIDFNSVSIDGSGSPNVSSVALELGGSTAVNNVRNNVLSNTTGAQTGVAVHMAIRATATTAMGGAGSVCNYNDYYVPNTTNGFIGQANLTNYATLGAWQAALTSHPGIDANTVTVDPGFVNPATDLHAGGLGINNMGNVLGATWVTTDFDGESRALVPDIGSDEFTPATVDMGANGLASPALTGCYTASETVTATIKNFGLAMIDFSVNPSTVTVTVTTPVSYTSTTTVNTGTLAIGATLDVVMPDLINMTAGGVYTFNVSVTTPGDGNAINNSTTAGRTVIAPTPIPYTETFPVTGTPAGWSTSGFSFGTHTGATETNQAYRNTYSGNPTGNFTIKKVGPIDADTELSFDYRITTWSAGTTVEDDPLWGNIIISMSTDCGLTFFNVDTVTTAVLAYTNFTVPLGAWAGTTPIIRFTSNWGGGASADYWCDIDNIKIKTPPALDMGPTVLASPGAAGCYSATQPVSVTIKNFGTDAIDFSVNPVTVNVNMTGAGVATVSEVVSTGTLASGSTLDVLFASTVDMSLPGTYTFNVSTSVTGDGDASNDALAAINRTTVATTAIPYSENFNALAALPTGWSNSGFTFGTHTGALESNQAYRNTWSGSTTGNFTVKKVGPVTATSALTFDYRITEWSAGATVESDPAWGNIVVTISDDCGLSFDTLGVITTAVLAYTNVTYLLGDYAGSDVIVNFKSNWGGGAGADYWCDIDNINFSNDACVGTPVAGTANASPTTLCAGTSTSLSLTGATTGIGITYQWQSSGDDITYANIAGATTATYAATVTESTYYRCIVTCAASGDADTSSSVSVTATPNPVGDSFATAISIGDLATPYIAAGDNLSSNCWTSQYGFSSPDVYYTFTPSCNGPVTISLCGSSFNTELYLLNSGGTLLASNSDFCGSQSQLTYTLIDAGVTYYIVVEGFSVFEGTYSLNVSQTPVYNAWYADADGDSYGDPADEIITCDGIAPLGYVGNDLDCDDTDPLVNPTGTEMCNGYDDDCDGLTDDADPGVIGTFIWYADADGDTFGDVLITTAACVAPVGYTGDPSDCDDTNAAINPAAAEVCNGFDDNCDFLVDDADPGLVGAPTWYLDADLDGYGDPAITATGCISPVGYVATGDDCDDTDNAINPAATEICNAIDDDCDGTADDGLPFVTYYADADGDTYGDAFATTSSCDGAPAGYVSDNTDCDDTQSTVYPGATEVCDGFDNDCDGEYDEGVITATITPAVGAVTCKGDLFTFAANDGPGFTFQWFKNGNVIVGATASTYATDKSGWYTVQVNLPEGCFDVSDGSYLTVNPTVNNAITAPNGTSLCTTVRLKVATGVGLTYVWYKDDVVIPGATSNLYFPTTAGSYKCTLTNTFGCSRTTASIVVTACREGSEVAESSMNVYPNPTDDQFTIQLNMGNGFNGNADIFVMNMVGEVVHTTQTAVINGTLTSDILLSDNIAGGVYLVKVVADGQQFNKQLSIVK